MNILRKRTIAGTACILFSAFGFISTAAAGSSAPSMEEMMGEGISHPSPSSDTGSYAGDHSIPSAEEMMGEGILLSPRPQTSQDYAYDASSPSAPEIMGEGILFLGENEPTERSEKKLELAIK